MPTVALGIAAIWYALVTTGKLWLRTFSELNYELTPSIYFGLPLAVATIILLTEFIDTDSKLFLVRAGVAIAAFVFAILNFNSHPESWVHYVGAVMLILAQLVVVIIGVVSNMRSVRKTSFAYRSSLAALISTSIAGGLVMIAKLVEIFTNSHPSALTFTNASYGVVVLLSVASYAYVSLMRPFDFKRN